MRLLTYLARIHSVLARWWLNGVSALIKEMLPEKHNTGPEINPGPDKLYDTFTLVDWHLPKTSVLFYRFNRITASILRKARCIYWMERNALLKTDSSFIALSSGLVCIVFQCDTCPIFHTSVDRNQQPRWTWDGAKLAVASPGRQLDQRDWPFHIVHDQLFSLQGCSLPASCLCFPWLAEDVAAMRKSCRCHWPVQI